VCGLLNLLMKAIEADPYPLSPHVQVLRAILAKFGTMPPAPRPPTRPPTQEERAPTAQPEKQSQVRIPRVPATPSQGGDRGRSDPSSSLAGCSSANPSHSLRPSDRQGAPHQKSREKWILPRSDGHKPIRSRRPTRSQSSLRLRASRPRQLTWRHCSGGRLTEPEAGPPNQGEAAQLAANVSAGSSVLVSGASNARTTAARCRNRLFSAAPTMSAASSVSVFSSIRGSATASGSWGRFK
jgi:hypothetical protein